MRRRKPQLNQLAIDTPLATETAPPTGRTIGDVVYFAPYYFHVMRADNGCNGCYWWLNDTCYITPSMATFLGVCSQTNRADNNNVIFKYLKYKNNED